MPFRQIFWSQNGAPANIVGHRWNTEAFRQITSYSLGWPSSSLFSGPNCPQTRALASKISKNFPGVSSRTHPQYGYMPWAGAQPPPLLRPRSWKPLPQIKIHHYTPAYSSSLVTLARLSTSSSAPITDCSFQYASPSINHALDCQIMTHVVMALVPSVPSTHHSHHLSSPHSFIPALNLGMPQNRRTPQDAIVKTAGHRRMLLWRPQDTQMNNVDL